MKWKRYKRKKSISYISVILLLILLAVIAFLITFTTLYLLDRFKQIEMVSASNEYTQIVVEDTAFVMKESQKPDGEPTQTVTGGYVVLDAGHGENDGGTYYKDVIEKDINLAVTMCLKDILEENDVKVLMTRSTDEYLSLEERTVIANQTDADLFVSVHCNYYEDSTSVYGIDCYYYPNCEEGEQCAGMIASALKENGSFKVRGAKAEEFYVTENTNMTAILIEVGFLSNPTERKNLTDAGYQEMLAEEMANGIIAYLEDSGAAND